MPNNQPLHLPENQENRDVQNRDDPENDAGHNSVATDEENCCNEDDYVFVDS